jgi:hypothetical protein
MILPRDAPFLEAGPMQPQARLLPLLNSLHNEPSLLTAVTIVAVMKVMFSQTRLVL